MQLYVIEHEKHAKRKQIPSSIARLRTNKTNAFVIDQRRTLRMRITRVLSWRKKDRNVPFFCCKRRGIASSLLFSKKTLKRPPSSSLDVVHPGSRFNRLFFKFHKIIVSARRIVRTWHGPSPVS